MNLATINCKQIPSPIWSPGTCPKLQNMEVHLWRIRLNLPVGKLSYLEKLLTSEEKNKASKYINQKDRNSFIIGQACTKKLGAQYLNIEASQVIFQIGMNGKPYIPIDHKLHFNISHSGEWVFIAFDSQELGLDLEKIAGNFITDALLEQCFHSNELKVIKESYDPIAEFYKFWTRKEAFLKATGIGIVETLNQFTCLDQYQEFMFPSLSNKTNWQLRSFFMDHSYAVSICTSPLSNRVRFFDYESEINLT